MKAINLFILSSLLIISAQAQSIGGSGGASGAFVGFYTVGPGVGSTLSTTVSVSGPTQSECNDNLATEIANHSNVISWYYCKKANLAGDIIVNIAQQVSGGNGTGNGVAIDAVALEALNEQYQINSFEAEIEALQRQYNIREYRLETLQLYKDAMREKQREARRTKVKSVGR